MSQPNQTLTRLMASLIMFRRGGLMLLDIVLAITMDLVPPYGLNAQFKNKSSDISILVVDDDEDNLLLLSYALEAIDFFTVKGSSGKDAIRLALSHAPDLILLDILLPDMNGTAVIKQLRQQPAIQNKPIIAVTALAYPIERSKIIAAGFTDYLSKPYMLDELYALINKYLN